LLATLLEQGLLARLDLPPQYCAPSECSAVSTEIASYCRRTKIFAAREWVRDRVLRHISRLRRARSGDLLVVNIHSWEGLFAHLEWFLEISLHCERFALRPCFMSSSPQYVEPARGPDWYAYFFLNPQLTAEDDMRIGRGQVPVCRIENIGQLGLPADYDSELSLSNAPALVHKYIGVNDDVLEKVNAFVGTHFKGKTVLGVHYRGTDKRVEAPRLTYEHVRNAIDGQLTRSGRFDCLFVSSDEQEFIHFMQRSFLRSIPVVWHDDEERSRTDVPVHHAASGNRFRRGQEAVLNCLLLSRCSALLKTSSILSGWSKLFNPALPVTLLAGPYQRHLWFPDRALVRDTVAV
jgi:hypothetical protein